MVYIRTHVNTLARRLSDLTLAVATINAWNRLSILAGMVAGSIALIQKSQSPIILLAHL
jgi:hypothetical protein